MSDKKDYHCSFCGKHKNEISTLIAGPSTFICNECIDLCHSIVHEKKKSDKSNKDFKKERKMIRQKLNQTATLLLQMKSKSF